jgi:hypothetical protein
MLFISAQNSKRLIEVGNVNLLRGAIVRLAVRALLTDGNRLDLGASVNGSIHVDLVNRFTSHVFIILFGIWYRLPSAAELRRRGRLHASLSKTSELASSPTKIDYQKRRHPVNKKVKPDAKINSGEMPD